MSRLLSQISESIGVHQLDALALIKSAPRRYKSFLIPKKNSTEKRKVAQPAKEVKILQRWLVAHILDTLPVHSAATAYVKAGGIKKNASAHCNAKYLLKMDFRGFFPSIKYRQVISFLSYSLSTDYEEEDCDLMAKILLWQPSRDSDLELCIGGPSSPSLSNVIMYEFDAEVHQRCQDLSVVYTRYADDLTFSSVHPAQLKNVERMVRECAKKQRFLNISINESKTLHLSRRQKWRVTGLIINNEGKVSLGRDRKREIRAMLDYYRRGKLSAEEVRKLRGYLAFSADVEPSFLVSLERNFGRSLRNI